MRHRDTLDAGREGFIRDYGEPLRIIPASEDRAQMQVRGLKNTKRGQDVFQFIPEEGL